MAEAGANTAGRNDLAKSAISPRTSGSLRAHGPEERPLPWARGRIARATARPSWAERPGLGHEQTRHQLELLRALTDAVDWDITTRVVDWDQVVPAPGRDRGVTRRGGAAEPALSRAHPGGTTAVVRTAQRRAYEAA